MAKSSSQLLLYLLLLLTGKLNCNIKIVINAEKQIYIFSDGKCFEVTVVIAPEMSTIISLKLTEILLELQINDVLAYTIRDIN
jgi:hypothetical protein